MLKTLKPDRGAIFCRVEGVRADFAHLLVEALPNVHLSIVETGSATILPAADVRQRLQDTATADL